MLHPATLKLLDKLYDLTSKRMIAWTCETNSRGVYRASGYEIEVCRDPCQVRIMRDSGRALESLGATELSEVCDEDGRPYDCIVREMAMDAVRIASGLDQAVSTLMEALEHQAEPQVLNSDLVSGRVVHLSDENQRRSGQLLPATTKPNDEIAPASARRTGSMDYSAWT